MSGDDPLAKVAAEKFVLDLVKSDDIVVVVNPSPFMRKFWQVCKSGDSTAQSVAGVFKDMIYLDSSRCIKIDASGLAALTGQLSAVKDDDEYLVQAIDYVGQCVFVTTDHKLLDILR